MKYSIRFLGHTSHFEVSVYASQLPVLVSFAYLTQLEVPGKKMLQCRKPHFPTGLRTFVMVVVGGRWCWEYKKGSRTRDQKASLQ